MERDKTDQTFSSDSLSRLTRSLVPFDTFSATALVKQRGGSGSRDAFGSAFEFSNAFRTLSNATSLTSSIPDFSKLTEPLFRFSAFAHFDVKVFDPAFRQLDLSRFSQLSSRFFSPLFSISDTWAENGQKLSAIGLGLRDITDSLSVFTRSALDSYNVRADSPLFNDLIDVTGVSTDSEDDHEIEAKLQDLEERLVREVRKTKPNLVSLEGLISYLVAIVFFLISHIESTQLSENIERLDSQTRTVLEVQTRIANELIRQTAVPTSRIELYIVRRTVGVRFKPSFRSSIFGKLYPTQKVILQERKGKWILVSYFSYTESQMMEGWVLKKYLVRSNG